MHDMHVCISFINFSVSITSFTPLIWLLLESRRVAEHTFDSIAFIAYDNIHFYESNSLTCGALFPTLLHSINIVEAHIICVLLAKLF